MISSNMSFANLEDVYDMIAAGIDKAGEQHSQLFLTKTVLALAAQLENPAQLQQIITASLKDLG